MDQSRVALVGISNAIVDVLCHVELTSSQASGRHRVR